MSHFTFRVPEELLPWHDAKCSWAIRPGLPSLFQEGLGLSNWWAQSPSCPEVQAQSALWKEPPGRQRVGRRSCVGHRLRLDRPQGTLGPSHPGKRGGKHFWNLRAREAVP